MLVKSPPVKKAVPRTAAAAKKLTDNALTDEAPVLTEEQRREAFRLLWADRPTLIRDCCQNGNVLEAAEMLEKKLWGCGATQYVHRTPPILASCEFGIAAGFGQGKSRRDDILTWHWLAEQAVALDYDYHWGSAHGRVKEHNDGPPGLFQVDELGLVVSAGNASTASRGSRPPAAQARESSSSIQPPASSLEVPIASITVFEDNPRKSFDETKLKELADSIKEHGVLQPLVVVAKGKRYGLVAGERRLRAAKLAGLAMVPVIVKSLTPEAAAEIRLIENLRREDLTPIEEAHGMAQMLMRFSYTQEQLAQKLGSSQGHVALVLGLLKLPEVWQKKLIAREITPTHVRALMPYAERPKLLERVAKLIDQHHDKIGNYKDFQVTVERNIRWETQELKGSDYDHRVHAHVPYFKPTEEQRKQLDIITVDGEERALNEKLWKTLQEKHTKEYIAKLGKEKKAKGKGSSKGGDRQPTAAELKARAKKLAEQVGRRVEEWRRNWLKFLLARHVEKQPAFGARVLLMGLNHGDRAIGYGDVETALHLPHDRTLGTSRLHSGPCEPETSIALCSDTAPVFARLAAGMLWVKFRDNTGKHETGEGEPRMLFAGEELDALAAAAGIDLAQDWAEAYSKPFCDAFWNLHGKAQLVELCRELKVKTVTRQPWGTTTSDADESMTKGDLVDLLKESPEASRTLPKEVERVKPLQQKTPAKKPAATEKGARR